MKIYLTNDKIIEVPESTDRKVTVVYKDNARVNICKEEAGFRYILYTIPFERIYILTLKIFDF